MIVYGGGILGFSVLLRVHGSAAYKAVVPSLCSTGILLAFEFGFGRPQSDQDLNWFGHPYPLASLIVAFTFLLTFKCSYSYNRHNCTKYWEACTAVYQMNSKLLDVGVQLASFHYQSAHFDEIKPPAYSAFPYISKVIRKRKRKVKKNIWHHHERSGDLSSVTEGRRIPRRGLDRIKSVARMDGGVDSQPSLFLQEASHLLSLLCAVAFSTLRNDIEGAETPLTEWIPGSPWPPVDPDNKAALIEGGETYEKGSITKVTSFLLGLSRTPYKRTMYNACRPFKVIGGVSDAEIDLLKIAHGPLAKTELCSMWLQEFITREYKNGALGAVDPPIVSRIYQCVSDAMLGYNLARKVAYVPFPFPHNQLTAFFTFVMMVILPILMLSYVHSLIIATILNALVIAVFVGLYEVGRELEAPFRNVPNDIPLNNFQAQFNEALVVMYSGYHPESWWELEKDNSNSSQI